MISQPNCAKALTNRKWAEITKDSEFQINKRDWKLWKVLIHNLGEGITQDTQKNEYNFLTEDQPSAYIQISKLFTMARIAKKMSPIMFIQKLESIS